MSHFKSELLPEPDYRTSIAKGDVPREREVFLIGWNREIGASFPQTLQPGGGEYVFLNNAEPLEVRSDSRDDRAGGRGATLLAVQGLDADWNKIEEAVFLQGTAAVPLAQSYIRINRLFLLGAGEYRTNRGAITLQTQSTPKVMQATIPADHGASRNGVFSVAAGHQVRIYRSLFTYSSPKPLAGGEHHALCSVRYLSTTSIPGLPTTFHFRENLWLAVSTGQSEIPTIIPTILVERSSIELRVHRGTQELGMCVGYVHGIEEDLRD